MKLLHVVWQVNGSLGQVTSWATPSQILHALDVGGLEFLKGEAWERIKAIGVGPCSDEEARYLLSQVSSPTEQSKVEAEADKHTQPATQNDAVDPENTAKCIRLQQLCWALKQWNRPVPFVRFWNGRELAVLGSIFQEELLGFGVARRLQVVGAGYVWREGRQSHSLERG